MAVDRSFADYCCELLAAASRLDARRMFGGWGLSTDGLTIALVADLGSGEKLWLKADEESRARFEAAGCERFTYSARGQPRSLNYYCAPEDAMESPQFMAPWARLALAAAVKAHAASLEKPRERPSSVAKVAAKPARSRAPATGAERPIPARKSAKR